MSPRAEQSCLRCRRQKRKCDKILPICSLCKRLNKSCSHPDHPETPRLLPVPDLLDLTPSNIRYTLEAQVSSVIGDGLQLREAAATYFRTVHTWLPAISETAYYAKLSRFRVEAAPSDFSVLTLCIFLVCAMPVNSDISLETRRLYILIKSFIAMLEAVGMNSLAMLQGRLLLTTFEIGHAMYPSAYISAGANIQAAVRLGASAVTSRDLFKAFPDARLAAEARQTWHGIVITNRYASLESNSGNSASLGRTTEMVWGNSGSEDLAQMNPFAKVAYSSLLLDQVLAHIHESKSQQLFNRIEAMQILNTVTSFLELFEGEGYALQTISNSSLAICRSAMLEILDFGSQVQQDDNEHCIQTSLNILTSLTHEIAHGASSVTANSNPALLETLPVFIPHSIYKAAIVYLRDERISGDIDKTLLIRPLKDILRYIGLRWGAAKYYSEQIEQEQKKLSL
ncbi:hypothetical protein V498_01535 [Pseudogymnoascus sp. VKM F-4517 (FW-2822)]|nr:hypothetical protein V498_01535 [Pseudogymnoascus sp. VKM F-4517 (FW-2822)]